MSFSYLANLVEDIHKVRYQIGDTVKDSGPQPLGENFEDEELQSVLAFEGNWQRAVAAALERLSTLWRPFPNIESDQFGLSRSHISKGFADDAKRWRSIWGQPTGTVAGRGIRTYSWTRVDAYSDDLPIDGEEV